MNGSSSEEYWDCQKLERYSLLQAIIWVATKGQGATHSEIAKEILDNNWGIPLFEHLKSSKILATGLNKNSKIYENIPNKFWMNVSRDDIETAVHSIDLTDNSITLYGNNLPEWTDIWIDGKLLLKYFSFNPKDTSKSRKLCKKWLIEQMQYSPTERISSKAALFKAAQAKFGISGRGFNTAWKDAVHLTGSAWSDRGRPRKPPTK